MAQRKLIVICATSGVLISISFGILVWVLFGKIELTQEGAAWVQAVGSILAIVVALSVPALQKWHEQRLQGALETKQRLDALYAVLAIVRTQLIAFESAAGAFRNRPILTDPDEKQREALFRLVRSAKDVSELPVATFGNEFVPEVLTIKARAGEGAHLSDRLVLRNGMMATHPVPNVGEKLNLIVYGLRDQESRLVELADGIRGTAD